MESLAKKTNKNNLIVKIFFIFWSISFLLSMQFLIPNLGGSFLPFNNALWASMSVVIAICVYYVGSNYELKYSKTGIYLLISVAIMSVPILYPSSNISSFFKIFAGLWSGIFLFFGLQQFSFTDKQIRILLYIILAGICLQGLFAWYEYTLIPAKNSIGYDVNVNRPYAVFQQRNVAASMFVTGISLSVYLLSKCINKYVKIWLLITPLILIPIVIVLQSRIGWLTLIIFVIFNSIYLVNENKKLFLKWIIATLIAIAIGLIFINHPEFFHDRKETIVRHVTNISPRLQIYAQALTVIKENFLFGIGYGDFDYKFVNEIANYYHNKNMPSEIIFLNLSHPHNEFLFWMIGGGVLGGLGFLMALFIIIKRALTFKKSKSLVYLSLIGPILMHSMVELPFFQATHWIIIVIFIFLIDRDATNPEEFKVKLLNKWQGLIPKVLYLPIASASYVFIITIIGNYYITMQQLVKKPEIKLSYLEKAISLTSIINPIATKLNLDLAYFQLSIGINTKNKQMLEKFIQWAELNKLESPQGYYWLSEAYRNSGLMDKAKATWDRGNYLFPNDKIFLNKSFMRGQ